MSDEDPLNPANHGDSDRSSAGSSGEPRPGPSSSSRGSRQGSRQASHDSGGGGGGGSGGSSGSRRGSEEGSDGKREKPPPPPPPPRGRPPKITKSKTMADPAAFGAEADRQASVRPLRSALHRSSSTINYPPRRISRQQTLDLSTTMEEDGRSLEPSPDPSQMDGETPLRSPATPTSPQSPEAARYHGRRRSSSIIPGETMMVLGKKGRSGGRSPRRGSAAFLMGDELVLQIGDAKRRLSSFCTTSSNE